MQVQDRRGIRIELGEAIKRGGEAKILEVRDQPNLVAKIYHAHRAEREAKLKAMLAKVPVQPATHTAIAWPIELLYEQGRLVGFLMPKIEGYDPIINFYNPARRKKRQPGFDWRYLHRTASNLAVVIETVHQAGHVVGDLNESNVLVNDQALVTLVDADSFQIAGPKGQIFRCPVGKAEYTPPELQGARFDKINRRPEHDQFGLAVLIFQLLMQGYHPFAGVLPAHLSVGRVDLMGIKQGLFPYHQNPKRLSIQKPPNAPAFTLLHPDLQALLTRCFVDGHRSPTQRPTAREWRAFLQRAEEALVTCPNIHLYSNHLASCPFCAPEQAIQIPLPPAHQSNAQRSTQIGAQSSSLPAASPALSPTVSPTLSPAPSRATFMPSLRALLPSLLNMPRSVVEKAWLLILTAIVGGLIVVNLNVFNLNNSSQSEQLVFFGTPETGSEVEGQEPGHSLATITAQNADQIKQVAYLGKGEVKDAAYSADGDLLAVASSIGIFLYDAQTLEQQRFIDVKASVHSVAFSPDGQIVASASDDQMMRLWSIDGTLLETIEGAYTNVAFSPDGQMLGSASDDNMVRLWSTNGRLIRALEGHSDDINSVAFSPDGEMVASASSDKTVRLWSTDGELIRVFSAHRDKVIYVAFSPDSGTLSSASDKIVHLWPTKGGAVSTLWDHPDKVRSVAFSPDQQIIATASYHTVHLWSKDGRHLNTLSGHTDTVRSVIFSPDSKTLLSVSNDQTLRVWSTDGTLRQGFRGHTSRISSIAFSPDGQILASASADTMHLWSIDGTHQGYISAPAVRSIAFSPDGQIIATDSASRKVSDDNMVRLWSTDGTLLQTLSGHTDSVRSVAFSPAGALVASASDDKTVRLWSTDGTPIHTLKGHTSRVLSVAFSPDGETLASASDDQTMRLWSTDGRLLETFSGHRSRVLSVAFSPDGQMLASASDDETVRLWSTDGTLIHTLLGHTSRVRSVAFSPTGELLASASWDKTVRLWSIDGTLLTTLSGHTKVVNDVAFSPDGQILASASWDGTVRLWGAKP